MICELSYVGFSRDALLIGEIALRSVLLEAACTPSPGLVDRLSPGAHNDMDFLVMMQGAAAIGGGFVAMAELGSRHEGDPSDLFNSMRRVGREAEKAMYRATGGVNTHKGAIFSLGLVSAAAGWLVRLRRSLTAENVTAAAAEMVSGITERELARLTSAGETCGLSHGQRIYLSYGIRGARGEAEDGFPTVLRFGLPSFRDALRHGLSLNDAMVECLLAIMAELDDTCVVHRSSVDTLRSVVQVGAREALSLGGMKTAEGRKGIEKLSRTLVSMGLSPGGAGDLLAVTLCLHFLETETGLAPKEAMHVAASTV